MDLFKKTLLCFGVSLNIIAIVVCTNDQSAARFEVKLLSFSSSGRVSDGTCCDSATDIFGCNGFGATDCDPQLEVCVGRCARQWTPACSGSRGGVVHGVALCDAPVSVPGRNKYHDAALWSRIEFPSHIATTGALYAYPAFAYSYHNPGNSKAGGKCSWTKEFSNKNSFDFGDYLADSLTNPLYKEYYPTWPGSGTVSMFVWDIDPGTHDEMGAKQTKTFTHKADKNDATSLWQRFDFTWTHSGGTVKVTAEIRAYCMANFYGDDCGKACIRGDTDDRGHYECSETGDKICHENYYGPECKAKCIPQDNDSGHYFCDNDGRKICNNGWQGESCIQDVDECATANPCSPNGNCTNLEGTYACECQPEYTGTNPGTDCNEVKQFCDENPSPCSNQSIYCNNTFGGYECTCEKYWRGRHCDEPPYCLSSPCSETGVCNDTDDGYVCTCQEGWQGRHCSEKITPCTSLPCLNNGICTVVDGAYNCTCVGVWEGPECQNEIKEIFYDNCTIVLVGRLTTNKENDFRNYVKELLVATGFPECIVDTESTYDNIGKTSVLITASSHDPRIQGALQDLPLSILGKNLPLYREDEPVTKPVTVAPKTSPWVKEHWYVILLIVLVLVAVIAGLVVFLFIMKKRRLDQLKQSGFDHDSPVHPVNGATPDAAIGFDNSLYYEIRNPESIEGLPNGKAFN